MSDEKIGDGKTELNWDPPNREQQINANNYDSSIKLDKHYYGHQSNLELIYSSMNNDIKNILFNDKLWNQFYKYKTKPKPNDWLYSRKYERSGQTFAQWFPPKRTPKCYKNTIGLMTIGNFNIKFKIGGIKVSLIDILTEYIQVFFDMKVRLLKGVDVKNKKYKITRRYANHLQIKTVDIHFMLSDILDDNDDLFCLVGVTLIDLYPNESWNYVFGEADTKLGTGIFSFARYLPGFFKGKVNDIINNKSKNPNISKYLKTKKDQILFIRRCLQVLSHEIGHLFDLHHCIYFECLLNGSNHLNESDKSPLQLCPICLHKLYIAKMKDVNDKYIENPKLYQKDNINQNNNNNNDSNTLSSIFVKLMSKKTTQSQDNEPSKPFNLLYRYQKLQTFYSKMLLKSDQKWCELRINSCNQDTKSKIV